MRSFKTGFSSSFWILSGIIMLQLIGHIILASNNIIPLWAPFSWCLLVSNLFILLYSLFRKTDPLMNLGLVLIIAGHHLAGQLFTNDALSSGTMLVGNLLVLYVGLKLFQFGKPMQQWSFIISYSALFFIFIIHLPHAEPLFLMAILGLAATAKDLKLLSYFWAIVISFSLAQPYAWETLLLLFLALKLLFTIKAPFPSTTATVFLILGLIGLLFVIFPIIAMMLGENPYNLFNVLKDHDLMEAIGLTLFTATISTILLAFIALPLGYAISRLEFKLKPLLLSLIDIPIIVPQSVAGIALLKILGKQQVIGELIFHVFGLRFDGTILGIIAAQLFVALPFFMRSAIAAYDSIPIHLEFAARNLGANSFQAYTRIALPLAARGLFLGAILAFARAAGEFGAVFFIASSPETAPIAVYTRFMSQGLSETAPLVSVMLIFSLLMFFLLQWVARLMPTITKQGGRLV